MSRKNSRNNEDLALPSLFDEVLESAEIFSRTDIQQKSQQETGPTEYDARQRTTEYAHRVIQSEAGWETTIQRARKLLLEIDPRQLYIDFFTDLAYKINNGAQNSSRLCDLFEAVAIRGFGMTRNEIQIGRPVRGATRWKVYINLERVKFHLANHIVGETFLSVLDVSHNPWATEKLLIGASDVSQHRSAVPVPSRFFKRSVPFILNNAAGTLYGGVTDGKPKYTNVINPKPDESLLRWMLIDPSYQDELEPEDYERCVATAMDIGQYKFDLNFLLKADKKPPNVIFRDGSIFPQDAYLDNFVMETRRGEFTREAIKELLDCLLYAGTLGVIYCGVTKNVQLKVYSAVVDWFIAKHIDTNWEFGNYTLNDGQAMTLLLSSPSFVGNNLQRALSTCLIRRSFTTRANLNTKVSPSSTLPEYFLHFAKQHQDIDITPFQRLCEVAHLYMFYLGHSKSPQQQLPRYEFYFNSPVTAPTATAERILASLSHCSLTVDHDHSVMSNDPVAYLMPSVTQQAHLLSKQVGEYIDRDTKQWIMSRFRHMQNRQEQG